MKPPTHDWEARIKEVVEDANYLPDGSWEIKYGQGTKYWDVLLAFFRTEIEAARAEGAAAEKEINNRLMKLLEYARCPDPDCDNNGSIAVRISDDEWEQQQCQWCHEKRLEFSPTNTV